MSDEVVVGALKPIHDRVTALLALDNTSDYKDLIADTGSTSPEILLGGLAGKLKRGNGNRGFAGAR